MADKMVLESGETFVIANNTKGEIDNCSAAKPTVFEVGSGSIKSESGDGEYVITHVFPKCKLVVIERKDAG